MVGERLSGKDLRQAFDFIHELYAPRNTDAFTTHLASALSRLVSADVHSYNEVNAAQHLVAYKILPQDFREVPDSKAILSRYLISIHLCNMPQ